MSTEAELYSELVVDLKGPKTKRLDWMTLAAKAKELSDIYGSWREAARKLGVSRQLYRAVLSLLDLPPAVQEMVRKRQILMDAAHRLNSIKDKRALVKVARLIRGLPSHQQREIIQYARKHSHDELLEYSKRVVAPSPKTERLHLLMVPLDDITFRAVRSASNRRGKSVQDLVLEAVHALLDKGDKR
jgi:hypothetical protein